MLEFKHKNTFFLFNFKQPKAQQACFFRFSFWKKQARILGSAQGRGVTWFLQTKDLFGVNAALKHYYRGGLWGKINRDYYRFSTLSNARSFAEFSLLKQLHEAGLAVPKPLGACVEKVAFGFYRADLLTEKIEHAQDLTVYLQQGKLTEQDWHKVGQLIHQLHSLQVCHTDLNAHNILVQQREDGRKFWLIDFDKCAHQLGERWKSENLNRLHRSFMKEVTRMKIQFSEQDWQALLAGYQA
ncbi:3-deoxy-D-manno-octulosonic acid kinase [Pasteurella multocida]|uniref:3-deoxy-D-manno-octulosonic acid kinase n=1 Tax=Pasteurella multocida TaxID=747 RepID=UPI0008E3CF15|nr:3-deoxy-D-manno-octulosonic acid kinase [Pasteurella multocida]SFP35516.1 3-deoxy-D-manno-octulosonic acid kinase [Pasteurella multocida]VEE37270.1 3-deoxy-D-manno-octulosonic acid kinase [Pasteurella multocida subsp. gallicida]